MADRARGRTRGLLRADWAVVGCLVALLWGAGALPTASAALATVAEESPVVQSTISAGGAYSCGVRTDGTLACWGTALQQSPPPVGTLTQVSAGLTHACGLRTDGTAACWGDNTSGQASPPGGSFTQVTAGTFHSCGIRTNGTL